MVTRIKTVAASDPTKSYLTLVINENLQQAPDKRLNVGLRPWEGFAE